MSEPYQPTLIDQLMVLEVERDLEQQRGEDAAAQDVEAEQFSLLREAVGLS